MSTVLGFPHHTVVRILGTSFFDCPSLWDVCWIVTSTGVHSIGYSLGYITKQPSQASQPSQGKSFNGVQGGFFKKTCPAGKTTAVVEGGALTARDILRPLGANIRSGKPPRRAHDHDIFAALLKVS